MPALSKEYLESEQKVVRKRYDLISQGIKRLFENQNLKMYKEKNEAKFE